MKTTIILTIAVLLISVTFAHAQTTKVTVESNSKGMQNISALYCEDDNFVFAQACEGGYWQAYAGKTYSPTSWSQVALGIGLEDASNPVRLGGWVQIGPLVHCFEDGGTGAWHRTILKYAVTPKLTLGVTDRSFYGKGMRTEVKLGRSSKLIGEYYEGGKSTLALSTAF